jgi:hypothetical protein
VIDAEVAMSLGKYPWEYYRETTPRQRAYLRLHLYVKQQREALSMAWSRKQSHG